MFTPAPVGLAQPAVNPVAVAVAGLFYSEVVQKRMREDTGGEGGVIAFYRLLAAISKFMQEHVDVRISPDVAKQFAQPTSDVPWPHYEVATGFNAAHPLLRKSLRVSFLRRDQSRLGGSLTIAIYTHTI